MWDWQSYIINIDRNLTYIIPYGIIGGIYAVFYYKTKKRKKQSIEQNILNKKSKKKQSTKTKIQKKRQKLCHTCPTSNPGWKE